jgi:hypothetical protein
MSEPAELATRYNGRDEGLWRSLLALIGVGEVVPIVGRDLLLVGAQRDLHLYSWLAQRVAQALGVRFDPDEPTKDPLNAVACRYLSEAPDADIRRIYINVFEEAKGMAALGLPDALVKLADIDEFKLFVTTTFDDSLRNAIDKVRFNGLARTDPHAFAPRQRDDLPKAVKDLTVPTVFHLLGRVSPTDDYVVTEEDALEFVHSLQRNMPAVLFNELYQKDLLVIGCRFPAWLIRSFIRIARAERLRQSNGRSVFVVDTGAREDATLIDFLRTFRTRTEVIDHVGPVEFVDDLHARWLNHAARNQSQPTEADQPLPVQGAIFLSYAAEDRSVTEQLAALLRDAKLEPWFDQQKISGGDRFEEHVQAGIRRSDLFIPILSQNCLVREERFFRKEWALAFDRARGLPGTVEFIFPVVIDKLPYDHEELPMAMRSLSWYSLTDGLDGFVEAVKRRYKKNQGD